MNDWKKALIIVLILALLAGSIYYFNFPKDNEIINTEVDTEDIETTTIDFSEGMDFYVAALASDSAGIDLNSDLKITCKESQELTKIKEAITITPQQDYEVENTSDKEFIIHFKQPLIANSIYKVDLKVENDKPLSWAFQTKKEFNIVRTLPRNLGTEVPVDSGIEIKFSYPDIESIDDYFEIEPKVEGRFEYFKDTVVFVHKGLEPDTVYTVKLKSGIGLKGSKESIQEDYNFKFATESDSVGERNNHYFHFTDTLYNFTSKNTPNLQVTTDRSFKDKELEVEIYQYQQEQVFFENLKKTNNPDNYWRGKSDSKVEIDLDKLDKIESFKTSLVAVEVDYGNITFISFPETINEGYYLINIISDDESYQTHIQVNDAVVYIMLGEKESVAWVNDSRTSLAIEGAKFSVENGEGTQTNSQGIAIISEEIVKKEEFTQTFFKIEMEGRPSFYAKVERDYYGYHDYYYFDDYYGHVNNSDYWSYLYLDRGIYLPNDKVNMWGLIKPRYSKEALNNGMIHLYKADYGDEVFELDTMEVGFNEFGSFEAEMELEDLIPGRYCIEFRVKDKVVINEFFEVRRYTKPAYEIKAEFDRDRMYGWETAELEVQASFFEGSPVSGLELDYSYYENDGYKNGNLSCDKNGSARFKFSPKTSTTNWHPSTVYINLNNSKAEDREIREGRSIKVFPRDVMIKLNNKVDKAKKEGIVEIETNKIDIYKEVDKSKEWNYEDTYKGDTIDIPLEIIIYEEYYTKVELGEYYDFINKKVCKEYRYDRHEKLLKTIDAETKYGYHNISFPFEEEKNYRVQVIGHDTRGEIIKESRYLHIFDYNSSSLSTKDYNLNNEEENKNNYRSGEKINLKLECNGNEVDDTNKDKLLFITLQDGLKSYEISENVINTIDFNEEHIPNYYIQGVYFDGEKIFDAGCQWITYDYTERELDIDVHPDKENLKPGEMVNLEIDVSDVDGKPVKTAVNISVVDEAFFAVQDQYVNTLREIYDYCFGTGIITNYFSYEDIDLMGGCMAEGGDGSEEEMIRSDFKDTAIFKSIVTDEYGKGKISFKLPDNLTSWRVTYQGLSKDLQAGNGKFNINAKLPFFVNLILSNKFMTGDDPYITARAFGTEIGEEDEVSYELILENEDGETKMFSQVSKGHTYTNIGLGRLKEGKYSVTIKARSGEYFDGIKKEFEVVDSMLQTTITEYIDIEPGSKIDGGKGYTRLDFYNESSALFYNTLRSLTYTWGERVDQKLSKKLSRDLVKKYFEDELYPEEDYQLDRYQLEDGGIALLPYSASEPILSAKLASIGSDLFDENDLKRYFYMIIENEKSIPEDVAAAYWGLTSLNEPVLLDIRRLQEESYLGVKEQLTLAIALAELGDMNCAEEIYSDIMSNYGKQSDIHAYIDTRVDRDDILETTSLASILALKLDKEEKYDLLKYVKNSKTKTILTNLEQLMFIMNDIPDTDQTGSFSYRLNGEEKEVKLSKDDNYQLLLNSEEVENIEFTKVDGDIVLAVSYEGPVNNIIDNKDETISLKRYYNGNSKEIEAFKQSDLIKITLKPDFVVAASDGYYEINDILPAGLRFVKVDSRQSRDWYMFERDGQKLTFGRYYGKNDIDGKIVYYARAIAPGSYLADNAIIRLSGSSSINSTDQQVIVIEE